MDLFRSILSDLIAGLIGAALLSTLLLLSRRVGPERWRLFAIKLRQLGWPLVTSVLFATALISAILRGATGPPVVALAVLLVLALASVILFLCKPVAVRRLRSSIGAYAWPILAGVFFLSTVTSLVIDIERERIVFVVDLADEELMTFRDVLDELEPKLGAEVFLMNVNFAYHVARLEKMVASGAMRWDLIAVKNDVVGALVAKGLVEELSKYSGYDEVVHYSLIPALRPLLKVEDRFYFAPFRATIKIAFYNEQKFAQYGLKPPKNWDQLLEVAKVFKKKEGVGRVAIQGYPGRTSATTVFEFVKAAGGEPLTLDDEGSHKAFKFLQKLRPYLAPEYTETRFDTANEMLIDGQVYLLSNWTYGFKVVVENAGKKEIKVYSGWKGPETEVHALGGDVLAIPKGAPHPNKAIKLIELLLSKETQQALVARLRWLPVRLDAHGERPPELASYFRAVDQALSLAEARPTGWQWGMVQNRLDRAFGGLIREGKDIASLKEHSAKLKETPSRYLRYRVEPGDTPETIARSHNTTVAILAEANGITNRIFIGPGQILLVPQQ